MPTLLLILIAIIAYTLGSVNGAIIASKYIFRRDIRELGSGNAGLTNTFRNFGPVGAALVLAIDILKTVLAVILGGLLLKIVGYPTLGRFFAMFCVALGHSYPIFYGFRGGKGVLCTGVAMIIIDWRIALICLAIFFLIVIFTRYVSLGSILGAICLPICVWAFHYGSMAGVLALLTTILILWKHRGNISRLIAGKESKIKFGKKSKPML